jgi:hypothetical protein
MRQIFMAVLLCVAVTGLCPQEVSGPIQEENKITAISITGLKKTKPHIIETPLQKLIGANAGTIDINEVFAAVKSTGVLEPLSVDILDNQKGNGKTLAVTVQEKGAIFPVPLISVHSNGWSAGGAMVNSNAFGRKDVVMVMGMAGTGDLTASVMYANTPDGIGKFGWNVMDFFSIKENETTDQTGEQTLRRYSSMSINPAIGLSYAMSEHIAPSLSLSYRYIQLRDTENPVNAPENGARGIILSSNISIHYNTWDGYFLNEKSVSLRYNYTLVINEDDVQSASLNALFTHSVIPGFRFVAKGGMTFSTPSTSPFFVLSPSSIGINILSGTYSANRFAGGSLSLEKHLFTLKFGSIALSAAYQAVYSHGDVLKHQFDHGAAAMAQVYFSGLTLPAMGLGWTYNVDKDSWQFAFNMGLTF